ncbi:NDMA-dependent alcohol dehydrogenase [Rhodococcus wratislaviensis]|uniref:alcohol dehydrogenase n=1 Tax=Rhodococcus wratislaviensis NBRC 100605 TaxID=1219028 RepID=X0PWG7_RHOWR|nr:NDMA-dependent alcohol dehydrogenase [Rhodococcus wratislaviensis]GAF47638.1 putative zinc-containing alcohol dehydrogenase [Rhodococcus wratislaviensis NBRC 100605]
MPTQSRAAVCWEVGRTWEVVDCLVADPGPGEVLVRMEAAGLCHSDDHNVTGDFPAQLPVVGGHEGAGTVVAVGTGVNRVREGDAVMTLALQTCGQCRYCSDGRSYLCDRNADVMTGARADGSFAFTTTDGLGIGAYGQLGTFSEYSLVQESRLMPFERDIPAAVAAVTACGVVTGFGSAVRVAQIRNGDTVVVVGVGGVGMSAVMGAKNAGAAQIVAVDPVASKREEALAFGATHTAADVDQATELVRGLTRNRMAEAAIITVGVMNGAMLGPVSALVGKGGNVVMTSVSRFDDNQATLPLVEFAMSAKSLLGVVMGQTRPLADVDRILALYRSGSLPLDRLVSRTYKLDDINLGYRDMHDGKNIRGVLTF